jgi:hypothetical protein
VKCISQQGVSLDLRKAIAEYRSRIERLIKRQVSAIPNLLLGLVFLEGNVVIFAGAVLLGWPPNCLRSGAVDSSYNPWPRLACSLTQGHFIKTQFGAIPNFMFHLIVLEGNIVDSAGALLLGWPLGCLCCGLLCSSYSQGWHAAQSDHQYSDD